jgi:DNA polymerase-4
MPLVQALRLCPQAIYARGRHERYHEKSREIMAIFGDFSPDVQQISVDEAFLDLTGTERLFGTPLETAKRLKARVHSETGLTVSIGVAPNKYLAKIASCMSKPDGLYEIKPGGEESFMRPLPVSKIWGAGSHAQDLFAKYGLKTCEDVSRLSPETLEVLFGKSFGAFLYKAVRGGDAHAFDDEARGSRSMSVERTFPFDLYDSDEIERALLDMSQTLMWRLFDAHLQSRTVALKVRCGDFSTTGCQETSEYPVRDTNDLYTRVRSLFRKKHTKGSAASRLGIRLLGVALTNLEDGSMPHQADLFEENSGKERRLEEAILAINKRIESSHAALKRAR